MLYLYSLFENLILMRVTLTRTDSRTGKESCNLLTVKALMERVQSPTKADRSNLERFRAHMEDFSKRYHLDMFFSCDQYLEFLPEGINKGSGIRFLCDYLQIPLDNTLAAGDAENDITMLETVKLPCVMKNARPEMYPYGKYITEHDNNHSGIAEIIEKFML